MRELKDHKVNPANDTLTIRVLDEPGAGGACHKYEIDGYDVRTNKSLRTNKSYDEETDYCSGLILFQNGPIAEVGVNGVTQEALLAIVIDRLRSFQAGPYACRENEMALARIEEAMHWLHSRPLARMRRGVEGTHEK